MCEDEGTGRMVVLGCGYVGSRLVRDAVRRGYRVTALSRNPGKLRSLAAKERVEVIEADLASDVWHNRIDPRPAVVVNCVGAGGGGAAGYRRSYLEGMESVARWLAGGGAGVAVYTGSIGVYPRNDGSVVDETAEVGGHSLYADLLLAAEDCFLGRGFSADKRLVLRLAGIYGPGRHAFLDRILKGSGVLSGRGDDFMNAVHLEDVCGAVWTAIESGGGVANGIYNVVDDCPTPRREVAQWLAARAGVPCPRFEEKEASESGRRRSRNRRISNDRIKELLGWKPRYPDFRAGYREILESLEKTG